MTATPAISATDVSKTYRIQRRAQQPDTLVESVLHRVMHPRRRQQVELFEALRDVSFEIPWGEAVGIVGRNGAGKSTLLKILTRVTAPSTGRIQLGGRLGSLLEVGTGFHGELTGRENIFLNGTLLGMHRKEIQQHFDEIVEFAGVEQFLDTPVKRYSSGMYVRLAFSVAAHLDTEILAVDEVLAVGDAEFQSKSLAKMRDAAKTGRTILYVSHQIPTVVNLCTSAIYLDRGRLVYHGTVDGALDRYRQSFVEMAERQSDPSSRAGSGELRFAHVHPQAEIVDPADDKVIAFAVGRNPSFTGSYYVSCHVSDSSGTVITQCDSRVVNTWLDPSRTVEGEIRIRGLWLKPGTYSVDMFLCKVGAANIDNWIGACTFEVSPIAPYPASTTAEALDGGTVWSDFSYSVGA